MLDGDGLTGLFRTAMLATGLMGHPQPLLRPPPEFVHCSLRQFRPQLNPLREVRNGAGQGVDHGNAMGSLKTAYQQFRNFRAEQVVGVADLRVAADPPRQAGLLYAFGRRL